MEIRMKRNRVSFLAIAALAAIQAGAGTAADGQQAFNNSCRTCHTIKQGDNRLGPSLFGVVGRSAGTLSGYRFSAAMESSGVIWDETSLDKFIAEPEAVINGNAMKPYGGLSDAAQRKAIIDYLKENG
jgi:cytochrome c